MLLERAREHPWYHVLELPGLTTRGWFDLRGAVGEYGLPDDLTGRRVLEVGTWDGFWAFELERRGAAEVVALDLDDERELDWPPRRRPQRFSDVPRGDGFRLAKELLGSKAERVDLSVYRATPEELGTFDLVLCSAVLIHLRDQLLALERMAALTAPGGRCVLAEEHWRLGGLLPFAASRYQADRDASVVFWKPNARAWRRMLWTAGFDDVREHGRFTMRATDGLEVPHVVLHAQKR